MDECMQVVWGESFQEKLKQVVKSLIYHPPQLANTWQGNDVTKMM